MAKLYELINHKHEMLFAVDMMFESVALGQFSSVSLTEGEMGCWEEE